MRALFLAASLLFATSAAADGKKPPKPPSGKTILKLDIEPPSNVFIDGKARGSSTKFKQVELSPGAHIVRVVYKRDEHEEQVILKKGEVSEYHWKFEDAEPKKPPPPPEGEEKEGATEDGKPKGIGADEPAVDDKPARPADPAVETPAPKGKGKVQRKDPFEGVDAPK
jgi:hypothetical protein